MVQKLICYIICWRHVQICLAVMRNATISAPVNQIIKSVVWPRNMQRQYDNLPALAITRAASSVVAAARHAITYNMSHRLAYWITRWYTWWSILLTLLTVNEMVRRSVGSSSSWRETGNTKENGNNSEELHDWFSWELDWDIKRVVDEFSNAAIQLGLFIFDRDGPGHTAHCISSSGAVSIMTKAMVVLWSFLQCINVIRYLEKEVDTKLLLNTGSCERCTATFRYSSPLFSLAWLELVIRCMHTKPKSNPRTYGPK